MKNSLEQRVESAQCGQSGCEGVGSVCTVGHLVWKDGGLTFSRGTVLTKRTLNMWPIAYLEIWNFRAQ